jgi:hypothetical protein
MNATFTTTFSSPGTKSVTIIACHFAACAAQKAATVYLRKSGDLNNDGTVNDTDKDILVAAWNQCGNNSPADLNGDGCVTIQDFSIILTLYGTSG